MNNVVLIGRLTNDPNTYTTGNGTSVCTFTLAVDRRYTDNNGDRQADFIPIVCWRKLAENVGKYMLKGRKVGVCGSIQVRSYEAKDGGKRYITEVIADEVEFLDAGGDNRRGNSSKQNQPAEPYGEMMEDDSDLPF